MAVVSLDPVEGLLRLQEELDRYFGKPQFDLGLTGPNVFPLVNVFTDADGLVVQAEVPGVKPSQRSRGPAEWEFGESLEQALCLHGSGCPGKVKTSVSIGGCQELEHE